MDYDVAHPRSSPHYADFGETPVDWHYCRLGDVLREVDVRVRDLEGCDADKVPVLSLTKNQGLMLQSERFHNRIATEDLSAYKVVRYGWIVYNPFVIWEGAICGLTRMEQGVVSPAYPVWEADGTSPQFLNYLLRTSTMLETYSRLSSGAVNRRRSIRKADFLDIGVNLPLLAEQRAIARVLWLAQSALEATEAVIAATRELKKSLMRHLFTYGPVPVQDAERVVLRETKIGSVPEHWAIAPLEHLAFVQTGVAKGRRLNATSSVTLPYLRVANVQDGYLDLSEMKTIEIDARELPRYRLERGDVVLTEGGDFDKLGRGFVWRGQIEKCVHQNHVFAVRVDRQRLLPDYVAYLAQSAYGKSYFLTVAHRTTHLACINSAKLKALPVPVPPLEEQQAMIDTLEAADRKIGAEEGRKQALEALFNSLLHNLMTGKVRVPPSTGG